MTSHNCTHENFPKKNTNLVCYTFQRIKEKIEHI